MLRVGDLVERINGMNGDIPEGTQAKISTEPSLISQQNKGYDLK